MYVYGRFRRGVPLLHGGGATGREGGERPAAQPSPLPAAAGTVHNRPTLEEYAKF